MNRARKKAFYAGFLASCHGQRPAVLTRDLRWFSGFWTGLSAKPWNAVNFLTGALPIRQNGGDSHRRGATVRADAATSTSRGVTKHSPPHATNTVVTATPPGCRCQWGVFRLRARPAGRRSGGPEDLTFYGERHGITTAKAQRRHSTVERPCGSSRESASLRCELHWRPIDARWRPRRRSHSPSPGRAQVPS